MNIFEYGNPESKLILVQMVDDHDLEGIENEVALIQESVSRDFRLIAFKVDDWNRDLSPWEAEPVFGKVPFGGKADETLTAVLKHIEGMGDTYIIGGYSLAGLFAIWAATQTGIQSDRAIQSDNTSQSDNVNQSDSAAQSATTIIQFSGVAAASPSVWFPNFLDYMKEHVPQADAIYLSLGDKEEKAKNPVMATVGETIRALHELFETQHIPTILEWNEGNHFKDADVRTAKAFAWVINQI